MRTLVKDPPKSAQAAGLVYVRDDRPGIERVRHGRGFFYRYQGKRIKDDDTLARIRALAIPPAWTRVWICPRPDGHLQATGRDVKGRKQYRYHAGWSSLRNATKFLHALDLGTRMPAIRARLAHDLALPGLPREKVLATVVSVMERTQIRVGNDAYAKENGSYGLSTLKDRHVERAGEDVRFVFRGKTGIRHRITLGSKRLARLVMRCKELPGQELFQYLDAEGEVHPIGSDQVNAYIAEIAGGPFTSKDLRTWMGTVHCVRALAAIESADDIRMRINTALDAVAERLGNTRAVCRKYYVHPAILLAYERQELDRYVRRARRRDGARWEEHVVMDVLIAT